MKPYTVWIVDTFENRVRSRTYETIEGATRKAARIMRVFYSELSFGYAVHITDGRGETISVEVCQ